MTVPNPSAITNLVAQRALLDGAPGGMPWDWPVPIPSSTDLASEEAQLTQLDLVDSDILAAEHDAALAAQVAESEAEAERAAALRHANRVRAERQRVQAAGIRASTELAPSPPPEPLKPNPILVAALAAQLRNPRQPVTASSAPWVGGVMLPPI
jgi:hypothetical protein